MNANKYQYPKAALITGASDRIGLELAKECLDLGYHAIVHYRTSAEPAKSVFGGDGRVAFIQAELTESSEKIMEDIGKLPVKLEGLINNASIFEPGDMSDPGHFQGILAVNTLAPLRLSAGFAKAVESGWVINITDAHTGCLSKKYQNYRVSKLFLDELTRQQAFLYSPRIRVNAVAPGAVLPSDDDPPNLFASLSTKIPLGKTGGPGNIRHAVRFLIENDYVTGAVIPVDGGWGL